MNTNHQAARSGHRVVVGYDGSDVSKAALTWGADQARAQGKLYVIYCRPAGKRVDEQAVRATLHIQAGRILADMDWELQILEGRPAQVLLAAAARCDADQIAVGLSSNGRASSGHDSVSRDLIRAADRAVVVVPAAYARGAR